MTSQLAEKEISDSNTLEEQIRLLTEERDSLLLRVN